MKNLYKFSYFIKDQYHKALSILANIRYGFPYRKLKIIGVSGTNGKTTTTQMIYHILKDNGFKVAYLSTISAKIGDKEIDTGFHVTTPDPQDVPKYLKMMVDQGVEYAILESTSQGLAQNRLWGIEFDAVTITNIQSDHLDYHKTWNNYAEAKFKLVRKLKNGGRAVLNEDDEKSAKFIKEKLKELNKNIDVIWYSKEDISSFEEKFSGLSYNYQGVKFNIPVVGDYNIYNSLSTINICSLYLPLEKIAESFKSFPIPTGRMQILQTTPKTVIIDFAHTPEALESSLITLNKLKNKESRTIAVYGCAGARDRARRKMGAVSAQNADITILTSEDSRHEDLKDINHEIFSHAEKAKGQIILEIDNHEDWQKQDIKAIKEKIEKTIKSGKKPFILFNENTVNSRKDAIDCSLQISNANDVVMITGKAHEPTLCFGDIEHPWSDVEVTSSFLKK